MSDLYCVALNNSNQALRNLRGAKPLPKIFPPSQGEGIKEGKLTNNLVKISGEGLDKVWYNTKNSLCMRVSSMIKLDKGGIIFDKWGSPNGELVVCSGIELKGIDKLFYKFIIIIRCFLSDMW